MATVDDYADGSIQDSIRKTLTFFDATERTLEHDEKWLHIQNRINEFEPLLLSLDQAIEYIMISKTIALGERICSAANPGSIYTESVFLDELAIEMIHSRHAKENSAEAAITYLERSSGRPIIISKVSGRYQEICASIHSQCVYMRAEKKGLHCLKRKQ